MYNPIYINNILSEICKECLNYTGICPIEAHNEGTIMIAGEPDLKCPMYLLYNKLKDEGIVL